MTPFRDLAADKQSRLREAYADEMARQGNTCSMDEKITRFNAWLQPQGITFSMADLRGKRQTESKR